MTGRATPLGRGGLASRQRTPRSVHLPRRRHHHDRSPMDVESTTDDVVTSIHADPVCATEVGGHE